MIKSQELIDRLRHELNLSINDASDDELWKISKDTFMCARINLEIVLGQFKKELINAFKQDFKNIWKKNK
jgi:hypothetical protein